jgi:predicted  nucleic acid-binding Zn-ribbon protein
MGRLAIAEKAVADRNAVREGLAKRVEPTLYRRYELVRKRRGNAISHTVGGTCSACHMQLPPMFFQQLVRGQTFSQCPSCARILYFRAEPSATDESAEST